MATFLFKTEPGTYSFSDLMRDKRTTWDGVTNAAARIHLRAAAKGDEVIIYHTGDEKRIAGLARVVNDPIEDPLDRGTNARGEIKAPLLSIEPVREATSVVAFTDLKEDRRFADFPLVRQPRLSVMPVPPDLDKALRKMSGL